MAQGAASLAAAAARVALGAVFVYAGVQKALAPDDFAWAVYHYRLVPYPAAAAIALYLPWLEIACGAGVWWRRTRIGALNLLLGLCLVFAGALASAWLRHLDIACGCFGGGAPGAGAPGWSLGRAVLLTLVSGVLLWRELGNPGGRAAGAPPEAGGRG